MNDDEYLPGLSVKMDKAYFSDIPPFEHIVWEKHTTTYTPEQWKEVERFAKLFKGSKIADNLSILELKIKTDEPFPVVSYRGRTCVIDLDGLEMNVGDILRLDPRTGKVTIEKKND